VAYTIECNGITKSYQEAGAYDIGTINSARDFDMTLTVQDSRGLTAKAKKTVKMVAYETPKATVDLRRLNNYEDETYLTVDGSVSSVLGKNTMTIQYRYRSSNGSYGSFATIGDRVKQTFSLDKNNVYVFNVVITDIFGTKFDGEYVLQKGVFPLFIDTVKNSVGINCFPQETNSLEVNGFNVLKNAMMWQEFADSNANKVKSQGVWIVSQGAVSNYPDNDGNGILIVFATPYNIYYQIFTRYDGTSWGRMCWYDSWGGWKLISS
jgi:hypothetical protein